MRCPTCQTLVPVAYERCPACSTTPRPVALGDALTAVEARATLHQSSSNGTMAAPTYAVDPSAVGESGGGESGGGESGGEVLHWHGPSLEAQLHPNQQARALLVAEPEVRRPPLLARLPELPALAWSRPTVRAAVKTGAGALALSLVVRATRQALAGRRRALAPLEGTLPQLLAKTLRPVESAPVRGGARRTGAVEVTEVLIYAQRVVRR